MVDLAQDETNTWLNCAMATVWGAQTWDCPTAKGAGFGL